MHTRLLDTATLLHFQQALASYRQRGYKIGIHLSEASDLDLLLTLGLTPDIIFADHPALTKLLVDTSLPEVFDPSLRILIAKKPSMDAHAIEAQVINVQGINKEISSAHSENN